MRAPLVYTVRIFDWVRFESVRSIAPLSAVTLSETFEHSNAIVDIRKLPSRYFAFGACLVQQLSALTHELGMIDRVLRDAMRGPGAVLANHRLRGPTVVSYDLAQTSGVRVVHRGHSRVIPFEQRTIRGKFRTHRLIVFVHLQ